MKSQPATGPSSPTRSSTWRPPSAPTISRRSSSRTAKRRAFVVNLIPEGAEVHSGKSKTLEDIGLYSELVESGRYDAMRPRMFAMERATQGREIRSTCPPVR
jgi:hypothetical protein